MSIPIACRGWLAALLVAAPLAAQSIPVVEKTLSNGMRLVMVERHDQPTISLGWMARVGSACLLYTSDAADE